MIGWESKNGPTPRPQGGWDGRGVFALFGSVARGSNTTPRRFGLFQRHASLRPGACASPSVQGHTVGGPTPLQTEGMISVQCRERPSQRPGAALRPDYGKELLHFRARDGRLG